MDRNSKKREFFKRKNTNTLRNMNRKFVVILTVHRDKLYNKANEMNFLEFYSD